MGESEKLKAAVLEKLREVKDPELGRDVVSLGMVKDLRACDGMVSLEFELTTPACPVREEFVKNVEEAVRAVPGVKKLDLKVSARVPKSRPAGRQEIPGVKNIFAVYSAKGGVGKSTVAANLAVALAMEGSRTGLLDADVHGPSAPKMLGLSGAIEAEGGKMVPLSGHGLKAMSIGFLADENTPVIWRGPMVFQAIRQLLFDVKWGELDYLVVDMPPGTGDAAITLLQQVPLAGVVIVTTPQEVATWVGRKGIQMFRKMEVPVLGIVENMAYYRCGHCGARTEILPGEGLKAVARKFGISLLGEIPIDPEIALRCDAGKPIVLDEKSPSGRILRQIARNLAGRVSVANLGPAPEKAPMPAGR